MSLLYVDGFDSYDTSAIGYRWDTALGCTIDNLHPRTLGGNYLKITDNIEKMFQPSSNVLVNGFAFRIDDYQISPNPFKISYYDVDGNLGVEYILSYDSGTNKYGFICKFNGGVLFTTAFTMVASNWYFIENKVLIDKTNGIVIMKINDSTEGTASGIATVDNSVSLESYSKVKYTVGAGCYELDDLYILDNTGSTHVDFLGNILILALAPDSDGTNTNFSPNGSANNFECVDEKNIDGDVTFVSSDILNSVDTYNYPDISNNYQIKAVVSNIVARKTDAGNRAISHVVRSGGTNYSLDDISLLDNYSFSQRVWEKDPNTLNDWDNTGLNSAEFGVKVTI